MAFLGQQNVGGAQKPFVGGYENVGGVLKKIIGGYQNVGGVLVPLVAGASMITFYIDTLTCTAEQGMTWEEWIESDYCNYGLTIDSDKTMYDRYSYYISLDGTFNNLAKSTDVIKDSYRYSTAFPNIPMPTT